MSNLGRNNLLKLAKVLKSNGTDGDIIISFREYLPEDLRIKEPVFIYFDGLPVPFFISNSQIKGNRIIAHLFGVDNLEDAEEIVGRDLFVDYELDSEDDDLQIIGWSIFDENNNHVGKVIDIEYIPGNPCLNVQTEKGEILIPFNMQLINEIDEDKEGIIMTIPKGLID